MSLLMPMLSSGFGWSYLDSELDSAALEEDLGRHARVEEHFRHCASLQEGFQLSRRFVLLSQCNTELFQTDGVDSGGRRDVDDETISSDGEVERSRVVGKLGKAVEEFREPIWYGDFLYRMEVVLGAIAVMGLSCASDLSASFS
jgi:hypothetical protein